MIWLWPIFVFQSLVVISGTALALLDGEWTWVDLGLCGWSWIVLTHWYSALLYRED